MPTVTQLKPQRNGKRVNVYLDDKFGFGIDLDNLVKFGININKFYSEEEIDHIIQKAEFQKTYDLLLRYVMMRPRSQKEVTNWFKKREVPLQLHNKLKKRLEKLELLDDTKFAKWWIQERLQFRPKGARALAAELAQKGVDRKIIDKILEEENLDEEKLAKNLLAKKSRRWESLDNATRRKKQTDFLLRNGFSWGIVKNLTNMADIE